jgi:hypothetical protein
MARFAAVAAVYASALAGAAAAIGPAARATPDATPAFTVGVLRRDAIIVPFATYDGRKWRADWPEPKDSYDVPINVSSVPKGWWGPIGPRETWQAWTADDPPRLLRVLRPDLLAAHCQRLVGLRTDYLSRELPPPVSVRPYPKDGLAVSPPQPIDRIDIVAGDDPERTRLAPVVSETFNRIERTLAARGTHPIPQADREQHEPAIEAVYAAGDDTRVLYVEAAREYRSHGDPAGACQVVAFGGGWFVRDRDRKYTPLKTYVIVVDCDRGPAFYMLPLGIVRVAGRTFWLAQFSGWEGEQYEVLETTPKNVDRLVIRRGGGC